jgi:hypothetical protein
MSRVERTTTTTDSNERRSTQPSRSRQDTPAPSSTPGKAEGEQSDIEQALENQEE